MTLRIALKKLIGNKWSGLWEFHNPQSIATIFFKNRAIISHLMYYLNSLP